MTAPNLRFKEYYIEWKTQELGDVTDITKLAGYEFTKHINYQDYGEIIALRGLNIKGNNLILDDVKYIDNSDLSMLSRSKLYIGDLLFTYVGTIGEVALIPENDKFYLAPNVCRIRKVNDSISSKFLMFLFGNESFKKSQIDRYTTKSSQPALSMENIRKFEIVFPIIEEQTKITSFLSAVDEKINQLSQKHNLLSQYKQGMMQKLFSQQIRFKADDGSEFGEWQTKSIKDVADVKGGKRIPKGYALIHENTGHPYITVSDMNRSYSIDSTNIRYVPLEVVNTIKRYTITDKDIFISVAGTLGIIGKIPIEFNGANLTENADKLTNLKCNQDFLIYLLDSGYLSELIESTATTSAQPKLALYAIEQLEIQIPCLEEQTQIANFLSAIDQKIEVVAQQIEQAKTWKKGLLQQMFV